MNGDSQFGVVPGQTPTTTPPFQPSPGGTDETTRRILDMLAKSVSQRRFAGTPRPSPIPGREDPQVAQQIGMNTAWPRAWSAERFMGGLQSMLRNAVAKHKEEQVYKAMGDWEYAQSALNEYYAAQQGGDQNAIAAAQKKLDVVFGDPKKLKNMAKALNQDWMNPEKTTVHGEALKRVMSETQQKEGKKQGAAQGIKNLFRHIIGQKQQPQYTPEEQQGIEKEIIERAPSTTGTAGMDVKTAKDIAMTYKDLRSSPEKYDIKTVKDADGSEKLMAVDKSDPTKPAIEVKSASGEKVRPAGKQYANEGKLEVVAGIPTGRVMHQGRYVAPGRSGYTKEDEEAVKLGMNAQNLSQEQKEKISRIRLSEYARERATVTPIAVIDNETGEATYAPMIDVAKNPQKYAPPGESEKIAARDSVHRSLKANFGALGTDLDKLPNGLDTETQATIALAMRSDNPGVLETLIVNKVKQNAPDEVLRYLTDMKAMQEDILVLRAVGGMGQGSDMMRAAMIRLIPGPGSSSVKEAKMQMEAAQRTSESLFKGRPEARFARDTAEAGKDRIKVQIPGQPPGWVPKSALPKFQKDHPDAKVF